ncbi:MAG: ComGF family competence protein [Candidatus Saccharicenans sp.]|nr:ComGF family competence protein [Candidatus Saccharicenans sp.]
MTRRLIAEASEDARRRIHSLRGGFSLLECLISLSLVFFILLSSLEIAAGARKVFFRQKEIQEKELAAGVALEKIREDLTTAGAGLSVITGTFDFLPFQAGEEKLMLFSAEEQTSLLEDAAAGQNYLLVALKPGLSSLLKKGRELAVFDGNTGGLFSISAVSGNCLTVLPPLSFDFQAGRTEVILMEKIEIYFDRQAGIVRRRVNGTTGQPLMEEVSNFNVTYSPQENLVHLSITFESGGKLHERELLYYPKNLPKSQAPGN